MVGDITCIPTWEGWMYLATVIGCYGKGVLGWATDDNYKTPHEVYTEYWNQQHAA